MLISADSVDELNQKVNQLLDQGMYLWGSPFVVPNSYHNQTRFFQQVSNVNPSGGGVDGKSAYQLWLEQPGNDGKTLDDFFDSVAGTRHKTEVFWTGISLTIPQDTPTNLINLIKSLVPTSGTPAPFFNTTDNKMHPFNENTTLTFKLNLKGTFSGSTSARSVTLDFVGTNGNTLTQNRNASVTESTLSFVTFFSIDKNGNMATNGTAINIFASGSPLVVTDILLVAEQIVKN